MKVNIGIKPEVTAHVTKVLSKIVADEFVLFAKTRDAHYNVEGPDFHSMHLFFEEQYTEIEDNVDEISERIRQVGHYAPAKLKDYLNLTSLTEDRDNRGNSSKEWIQDLLQDHETIILHLRENITSIDEQGDQGTADFIIALMQKHEKQAWMLRAHLK